MIIDTTKLRWLLKRKSESDEAKRLLRDAIEKVETWMKDYFPKKKERRT